LANRVFITGASGFIGGNLVNRLAFEGNNIYALTRSPIEYVDKRVTNAIGDIMEPEGFVSILKQIDVIYHCAAYITFSKKDFQKAYQVNVDGTRNILEAAHNAGVKKVVHLSACAVLGFSSDKSRIIDETANPYIKQYRDSVWTGRQETQLRSNYQIYL
jgi:dihydroflavonol-4-reductase